LGLLISLTNAAFGDIAVNRSFLSKPPMVAPVKIVEGNVDNIHPDAVAKIVIPSSLLPELQEPSYGSRISNESPVAGTTIAGLALSACAISLMFAVRTSPHRKKLVAGLIGCVLLAGLMLLANFYFPPKFIAPPANQSKPQPQIVIEVQKGGHEVILVLPNRK
jgi:hypothetical protein